MEGINTSPASWIKRALHLSDLQLIENLAFQIIPEFYAPFIPEEHNLFFVRTYQNLASLIQQTQNNYEYYLLNNDNMSIGYLGVFIDHEEGEMVLSKFYLLKQSRGMGIGSKAIKFLVRRALDLHLESISLTVNRANSDTIRFYKKFGFIVVKELHNKFDNGFEVLDYEMQIILKKGLRQRLKSKISE